MYISVHFIRRALELGLICLFAAGCGAQGSSTSNPSEPVGTLSVADFTYRTIGDCSEGTLMFKYLTVSGIQLWNDPELPIIVGNLDLYLMDDGTYSAHYWEHTGDTKSEIQKLSGTYGITERKILLEGLGEATYFELNNKFGLSIRFSRDILTTGLNGTEHSMRSVLRSQGLQTREEYCQ